MFQLPDMPRRNRRRLEVVEPNLGLYYDRPPVEIPDRGLADCLNVRIRDGKITNQNVGYELQFSLGLGNQVLLIDDFIQSNGAAITIFGTKEDLFQYDTVSDEPKYITPTYTTGTVETVTGSAVILGTGTVWIANSKAGDRIHIDSATQVDVDATWYTVLSVDSDTQITLTSNWLGSTNSGRPYTNRKVFTATDADFWDADVFPDAPIGSQSGLAAGDHWFATNGTELVVWDGLASTVIILSTPSSGLGFSCKTITYYKNMMLYGKILESGASRPGNFKNTAIADPENVTTLEANEFKMLEGVDFIESLMPLGDFVVGYGKDSIAIAQFVDVPVFFAIRTVAPSIGVYSARMIVDFGDFHEFLSNDRAYRFDGVRLQPFGEHVFPDILRRADRSRSSKSLTAVSEEELEVYWIVALSTDGDGDSKSPELAHTEHYAESVGRAPTPFSLRQLPATASGVFVDANVNVGRFSDFVGQGFDEVNFAMNNGALRSEFPIVLIGDEDGFIYKVNTTSRIGSSSEFPSFITTPTRRLWDGLDIGIVRRVEPYVEKNDSAGPIQIQVSTLDRMDGDATPGELLSVENDHSGSRFASERLAGRYARITMSTTELDTSWTLSGYGVIVDQAGER